MRSFTFGDIKQFLGTFRLEGSPDGKIFTEVTPVADAQPNSLVWINKNKQTAAEQTKARLILCHPTIDITLQMKADKCFIVVDNPKLVFAQIVDKLFNLEQLANGIHPSAVIHPEAQIHESVSIGAFCIIGNCFIEEGVKIRDFCKIYDGVKIGKYVNVYDHCTLGGTGFGYAVDDISGMPVHMPHIGSLEIGDNVDIFPYANIDRGTLGDTKIGNGTKIDHFCHIGHNSVIGSNCIITAQVVLCGSSGVGDNCWVGVGSIIKQSVYVGSGVTIGLGSIVTKNIPDGETWTGSPARKMEEFLQIQAKIKSLL